MHSFSITPNTSNLQHSISIVSFLFVLICSEALLNFYLTMPLSEEMKLSYVKKCSLTSRPEVECTDIETDFFTFADFRCKIFIFDFLKNWFLSHIDAYLIE